MEIRKAKLSEIKEVKILFDSAKKMDVIPETFPETYYKRILTKGILLVAIENRKIIGGCFGTYNKKEKWADLLGLVVKKNFRKRSIGSSLVKKFEEIAKIKKLKTIDLYAHEVQINLFKGLGYKKGQTYTSFRKRL